MAEDQARFDDWVSRVCGVDPRSYPESASNSNEPVQCEAEPSAIERRATVAGPSGGSDHQAATPQTSAADAEVCEQPEPEPNRSEAPDSEHDPHQCEGEPDAPRPAPAPPDDGSAATSPLHDVWQAGYDAGFAHPDEDQPAPAPYSEEAARIYEAGVEQGKADASQAPMTPTPKQSGSSTTLNPGMKGPEEEPASFAVGGIPAFRYNLPEVPIGTAELVTPGGLIILSLSLRGSVTVTFPNAPPGVSTDVNNQAWRLEASKAVGPVTSGIRVSGIGTGQLSIGATMGSKYAVTETRYIPPTTMAFIGQGKFDYKVPSHKLGEVAVKGQVGFELRMTIIPATPPPEPIQDADGWWDKVEKVALVVGAGVVVIAAIAAIPATDGASLILIEAVD